MNGYEWSVFITIVEQGSFVQAANMLNVSQSAVSHTISKLEKECGYLLLNRTRTGVTLTANGELILPYVRQMLNSENSLMQEVGKLKSKESGIVKIAAFHTATVLWLPEIIRNFKRKHPNIELIIKQSNDKGIYDMIALGEVDLAFATKEYIPEEAAFFPLHQSELVGISSEDFIPENQQSLTVEDFKHNNIILPYEGYTTEIMKIFQDNDLYAKCNYRIEDDDTVLTLVEQGFGLSIMPEMAIKCANHKLKEWHFNNREYMKVVGLVSVYSGRISPAASLFRQEVLDYANQNQIINL